MHERQGHLIRVGSFQRYLEHGFQYKFHGAEVEFIVLDHCNPRRTGFWGEFWILPAFLELVPYEPQALSNLACAVLLRNGEPEQPIEIGQGAFRRSFSQCSVMPGARYGDSVAITGEKGGFILFGQAIGDSA